MEAITELIKSIGFPCAMCVYLIWAHKKESEKAAEANNNVAMALNGLNETVATLKTLIVNYFTKE